MNDRTEQEIWLPIPEWEGYYEVSDQGQVRSVDRVIPHAMTGAARYKGRIMKASVTGPGRHLQVGLTRGCERGMFLVHRLVLTAFVGPCPEGLQGCHNNGNSQDNRVANLRWDTCSANNLDKVQHGTHNQARKTHCPQGHPYDAENTYVLPNGGRECRTCGRAKALIRMRRKRSEGAR